MMIINDLLNFYVVFIAKIFEIIVAFQNEVYKSLKGGIQSW